MSCLLHTCDISSTNDSQNVGIRLFLFRILTDSYYATPIAKQYHCILNHIILCGV